ncbi:MAG: hypothetical protein AABW58_04600 [Nanoarchaeota archaeon]
MKKYLILAIILSLILIQNVNADILPYGRRYIESCYQISNADNFQEYIFILDEQISRPKKLDLNDCFAVNKNGEATIFAIKKDLFDENEFNEKFDKYTYNYEDKINYFKKPELKNSDLNLRIYPLPKSNDPLRKTVIILNIKELNENSFTIRKEKILFTYEDGTSEEKNFISQDIWPEPSKKALLPWWFAEFWFAILPFLALIIMIGIFIYKRKR